MRVTYEWYKDMFVRFNSAECPYTHFLFTFYSFTATLSYCSCCCLTIKPTKCSTIQRFYGFWSVLAWQIFYPYPCAPLRQAMPAPCKGSNFYSFHRFHYLIFGFLLFRPMFAPQFVFVNVKNVEISWLLFIFFSVTGVCDLKLATPHFRCGSLDATSAYLYFHM